VLNLRAVQTTTGPLGRRPPSRSARQLAERPAGGPEFGADVVDHDTYVAVLPTGDLEWRASAPTRRLAARPVISSCPTLNSPVHDNRYPPTGPITLTDNVDQVHPVQGPWLERVHVDGPRPKPIARRLHPCAVVRTAFGLICSPRPPDVASAARRTKAGNVPPMAKRPRTPENSALARQEKRWA